MRVSQNTECVQVVEPPLVFSGPPGDLRGYVTVRNVGQGKAVVATVTARLHRGGKAQAHGRETICRVPLIVREGESRRHEIAFDFGVVAAGEYDGEVTIGPRDYAARFLVVTHDRVTIEPTRLVVQGKPGHTVTARLVVANQGNVRR